MTSLSLLLWIVAGVALQLLLWFAIEFRRHWGDYRALRDGSVAAATAAPESEPATMAAWSGWRPFRVARKEFEDAGQSICSFYLVPSDGLALPAFKPGQFLTFRLDTVGSDNQGEQIIRCYSLSAGPQPEHYRVSIKRVPGGRSSNHFHDHVAVGDILSVRAPSGHFHLDPSDAPVVLIGGGIGITPMLSMLDGCIAEQPQREVWLYYGVRHGGELALRTHLDALAAAHPTIHLCYGYSNPRPDERPGRDFHHHGRIDIALLRRQLPLKPLQFYICGPTPMMADLVAALDEWGVPPSRIHFEAFGPASIKRSAAPQAEATAGDIVVTFAKSGKALPWQTDAGSLLEFAESHGINVDSGCRAGGCGSCQTRIRSGEISYRQPPDHDPEPGTCLLCVSSPKTSLTLEA